MTSGPPDVFDPSNGAQSGSRRAAKHVIFGKRIRPPEREVSYRRERLKIIGSELNLLFAYRIDADVAFARLREEGEPALVLGASIGLALTVEIEPNTGFLVLFQEGSGSDCVLITASEERLIDQIVGVVSAVPGDLARRTADMAVDVLVGRSLEDIERRLILRTLLYFKGDRQQTALALGIDESSLRLKLRRYFRKAFGSSDASEERQ